MANLIPVAFQSPHRTGLAPTVIVKLGIQIPMAYFSEQRVLALNAAVGSVWMEALSSATPDRIWSDTLNLVHSVLQSQARLLTARISPVIKLPNELLVEVFAYLPLWDRVRTATVCHHWRDVSLRESRLLWSEIPAVRSPEACRALLARSGDVPVTFRFDQLKPDNVAAISTLLTKHLFHIKALDLTISTSVYGQTQYRVRMAHNLSVVLNDCAPMLERIRIRDSAGLLSGTFSDLPVLRSPILQTVELLGVDPSFLASCAGSSTVRAMLLVTPDIGYTFRLEHWSLICSFPCLETLSIKIAYRPFGPLEAAAARLPFSLRHLHLELSPELFQQLNCTNATAHMHTLRVSFAGPPGWIYLPTDVAPQVLALESVSAAAVCFKGTHADMMVMDASGRQRIIQAASLDYDWCRPWLEARKATICGLVQRPRTSLETVSTLPSLEELTLDLTPIPGTMGMHWFRSPRLICPNLRTVRVVCVGKSAEITLKVLSGFLQRTLDIGSTKLATLVLENVHISAAAGVDAIASLHDLAEIVSVLASGAVWPEYYLSWNRSWDELPC